MKWYVFEVKGFEEPIYGYFKDGELTFDCWGKNEWIADCRFNEWCNIEFDGENLRVYDCNGELIAEGHLIDIVEEGE